MATPSIAMIPSGYKAEKIYSVLPTDGDGDFTFDRNSTATRVNKNGLIEQVATDVPRLDYSNGSCPNLLLEPSSVNLITKSNEVTSVSGAIINLNAAISPDGTLNAFKIKFTGGSSNSGGLFSLQSQTSNFAADTLYTLSFYAKNLVGNGQVTARIDTDLGIVKQESFTATSNWQRYTVSFTTDAGSTKFSSNCRFKNFQENGEVLFYGVQLEKNLFATSLIPTTNGILTRGQDSASKGGLSSYINSTTGVLYSELSTVLNTDEKRISLSDGSNLNRVEFGFDTASNSLRVIVKDNDNDVLNTAIAISNNITDFLKIAIKYESGDTKVFVNGVLIGSPSTVAFGTIGTMDRLNLSTHTSSAFHFQGKIKDIRVYNTVLTDTELQTLTTI
tara:strand:- start:288 stop:1454 length:1167 start_codon:yes stop_codon:yes gene_type:complete